MKKNRQGVRFRYRVLEWIHGTKLIFLLVVGLVLVLGWVLIVQPDSEKSDDGLPAVTKTVKSIEETIQEANADQLIVMVETNFANLKNQTLPEQVEILDRQLILADRLVELGDVHTKFANRTRLTAYSVLDSYNGKHGLGRDSLRETLMGLADEMMESGDTKLVQEGHFANICAYAYDMTSNPGPEELEKCRAAIDFSLEKLPNDVTWIEKLKVVFVILDSGKVPQRNELMSYVSQKLLASEDSRVQGASLAFSTTAHFGKVDWPSLDSSLKSKSASNSRLEKQLQTLSQNPNVSPKVYQKFFILLERNALFRQRNEMNGYIEILRTAVDQIKISELKDQVRTRLEGTMSRIAMLEKVFAFEGESIDGQKISNESFANKPVLIVYFSFQQEDSAKLMARLAASPMPSQIDLIGVFVDEPNDRQLETLIQKFPDANFIRSDESKTFHKSLALDFAPMVALLDLNHQLLGTGLDLSDLRVWESKGWSN
jgi:hypothetical protein